jgi:general secretion pathway protein B
MSYILDALKRADTERERERGTVPGLHSQNLPSGNLQRDRRRQPPKLAHYVAWIGLFVLALVAAWAFWLAAEHQQDLASSTVSATEPVQTPAARAPAEAPVAPNAATAEPPAATTPDLPILAPPPPPPPPPPARAVRPRTADAAAANASTPANAPAAAAPATTAPSSDSAAAPQPAAAVRRFAELSPDLRAQLPQVNVSGSTYSSNPKLRTLIANGKVIQEGDEIAPGLQVETIGQRSAVLNFKGTRYSIGF